MGNQKTYIEEFMLKRKGTLHRKLKIRLSNTNPTKTGVNSCAPEGLAIPALQVAPIVLLTNDKKHNLIWKWR